MAEEGEAEPEEETLAEKTDIAADALDLVVTLTVDQIQEKQIKDLMFPAAVQLQMKELTEVVECRYTYPDPGTSLEDQHSLLWGSEEEPAPSRLDSWARGAVPIKVRPKLEVVMPTDESEIEGGMATGRSMRSVGSRGSRRSRATRSRDGTATSEEKEVVIVAHSKPVPPKKPHPLDEAARANVAEINVRINGVRAKEDALAAETAQIKSVLADLKGTEFAYNHKGEIVMLETVKVERLPSQDVHLRVGLWSKSQSGEEEAPGRPARKGGGRPTRGGKAAGKSKKEDAGVMGSVEMAGALQGNVVDSLPVGTQILLRAGETERPGPRRPRDPLHMSRKDYNKLLGDDGKLNHTGDLNTTKTLGGGEDRDEGEEEDEEIEPDKDWMEDARPATPPEEDAVPLPEALRNHIEFNQSIVGSTDWGTNPAPIAYNPPQPVDMSNITEARRMALGDPHRLPRERPFDKVPGIPPHLATRLPAPIYPAASGHGMGGMMSFMAADTSMQSQGGAPPDVSVSQRESSVVSLPPIGVNSSVLSQQSQGKGARSKRRSFNTNPPNVVHNLQPGLARRYLGVKASAH